MAAQIFTNLHPVMREQIQPEIHNIASIHIAFHFIQIITDQLEFREKHSIIYRSSGGSALTRD